MAQTQTPMPEIIPIFPLSGALLLPHGRLPLNIFEPRYVAMVDAALKGDRLIGMIQPQDQPEGADALFKVGCVGKIVEFSETEKGGYEIVLKGLTRFKYIADHALDPKGFRYAQVDTTAYATDKLADENLCVDRKKLCSNLRRYFKKHGMKCAWEKLDGVLDHELVTCLAMVCPFSVQEKQALLEAYDACARMELFMTMLDMECQCSCPFWH